MEQEEKICVMCIYYDDDEYDCYRSAEYKVNPVTGRKKKLLKDCADERSGDILSLLGLKCGPRGKYFTSREP